ncbi:Mycothiol acetyltransferase [Ensifer psoraleae]|uniref:GNAT family N-acetyltransferase n=1 Tax=Sinorhizobium psoraleae TaxID=520838 RepID=UPI001569AC9C|nr:GNAT family N-acetyltransferase [Sinorhizobium psoraleae]NRP74651.1 Mycothiol acetyltransferase [Sinorhizobium psoraleae]
MGKSLNQIVSYNEDLHAAAVLELINADRLIGQPYCDLSMLRLAQSGRSEVDSGWWMELKSPVIEVLERGSKVPGVMSYAEHQNGEIAHLLWLHARENDDAISALVDKFLSSTTAPTIQAFQFATALTSGLEALPVAARPSTHATLVGKGFSATDLWRYMHFTTPSRELSTLEGAVIKVDESVHGWRISAQEGDKEIGFVSAGSLFQGIGVIWLIEVEKEYRGQGVGRKLLGTAIKQLRSHGAGEIILYVDDDDRVPGSERNRTAANRLYDSVGFKEIDRLFSYDFKR